VKTRLVIDLNIHETIKSGNSENKASQWFKYSWDYEVM